MCVCYNQGMNKKAQQLLYEAGVAKNQLIRGFIGQDEARRTVGNYVNYFNKISTKYAIENKQKPKLISITGFLR